MKLTLPFLCVLGSLSAQEFYLPEDLKYTIARSALDSAQFTLNRCLVPVGGGRLAARASFVDQRGEAMTWHDFGKLEGPGWAANAVGGAYEIYVASEIYRREAEWKPKALAILDHVLEDGFIDEKSGFIEPYRRTQGTDFVLNFKANRDRKSVV